MRTPATRSRLVFLAAWGIACELADAQRLAARAARLLGEHPGVSGGEDHHPQPAGGQQHPDEQACCRVGPLGLIEHDDNGHVSFAAINALTIGRTRSSNDNPEAS